MSSGSDYWQSVGKEFRRVQSPLSPCEQDLELARHAMSLAPSDRSEIRRILVCGVTSALTRACWPAAEQLIGTDSSYPMIRAHWAGDGRPGRLAIQADWRHFPLPDASVDFVLADGSLNCHPLLELPPILESIHRVLRPGGLLIARTFLRPDPHETVEEVFRAMREDAIGSFHVFKLRLMTAVHGTDPAGLVLSDVHRRWISEGVDEEGLAKRTGWSIDDIRMLHLYEGIDSRFGYPCLAEFVAALEPWFEPIWRQAPDYELGERVPTHAFRRR